MSKSVLVIDTTDRCDQCQLCDIVNNICYGADEPIELDDIFEKPDWCPLRPMQEKKPKYLSINSEKGYCEGWNACIDEITGGTE